MSTKYYKLYLFVSCKLFLSKIVFHFSCLLVPLFLYLFFFCDTTKSRLIDIFLLFAVGWCFKAVFVFFFFANKEFIVPQAYISYSLWIHIVACLFVAPPNSYWFIKYKYQFVYYVCLLLRFV